MILRSYLGMYYISEYNSVITFMFQSIKNITNLMKHKKHAVSKTFKGLIM